MRWSLVLPAVLAVASCDEPGVHILSAQLYDPTRACVGVSDGVDVVNGPSTGDACNPSCITITSGSTTSVYVTTECPPFPLDYSVEAEDAAAEAGDPCPGAFAALAAYDDSGVTCPPPEGDGGEEAAAGDDGGGTGGDAATDGGTDAGGDAPSTD
jgi:hypothetical protein